ncbi:MAG: hypothetical protein Q9222_002013 [Ikaeria aurantiellina]
MRPDFETCANEFLNHSQDAYEQYIYHGPVQGILRAAKSSLITVQGCRALCGTGTAYYPWKDSSNTITTWVLPVVGLLVQAPFESNRAWQTVLLLVRWLGNPIATLSYILWNIKVTGKCALMVDMATKYDEYPDCDSEFAMMRDSLYVLAVMNQYSVNPGMPPVEAERLLRLVLFSNLLHLPESPNDKRSLLKRRIELASNLREDRKKGVVPVFVSFLWFVFSLGLTIDLSFSDIGTNETAHNLAVGFLMGWLPILILASTVDRNLVSADAIRTKLNRLIYDVKTALLDPEILAIYMKDTETSPEDFSWMYCLGNEDLFPKDFFVGFGGQGRSHWHYGVAHPLLAGMESKFMAEYGRDWLRHGYAARLAIVVGSRNINGLQMFDPRMAWQITASIFIIGGSVSGAFILSCKECLLFSKRLVDTPRFYPHGRSQLQKRRPPHLFHRCLCVAGDRAFSMGYLDFETYQYYADHGVYLIWGIATGLSLLVLTFGLSYIAIEYCTQSHLSTENYGRAMAGLKHTRWFKKHTLFIRAVPDAAINMGKLIWHKLTKGKARRTRRSLVWTPACKTNPPTIDARKEPGLHMQGTEEQWKNIFMSGHRRNTMGSSWTSRMGSNTQFKSRQTHSNNEDVEKG